MTINISNLFDISNQKQILSEINSLSPTASIELTLLIMEHLKESGEQLRLFRDIVFFNLKLHPEVHQLVNERYPIGWEWFVRKDCLNVKGGEYGKDPNLVFGTECHQQALKFLNLLREEKIASLDDIYLPLAQFRQECAKKTGTKNWENFGNLRDCVEGDFPYSPLKNGLNHYKEKIAEDIGNRIKNLCPKKIDEEFFVYDLRSENSDRHFYVVTKDEEIAYICFREVIDEKVITSTRILLSSDGALANFYFENDGLRLLSLSPEDRNQTILHCPSRSISILWSKADVIFKTIINPNHGLGKEQLLEKIAELHSYLADIMRVYRGNAAISEIIIVTLLLYHDFYVSPYKPGIIGDMEALTTPRHIFINNFRFLREVDLMATDSEKRVMDCIGGWHNFESIPSYPYWEDKIGYTGYPELTKPWQFNGPISRFRDQFRRKFLVIQEKDSTVPTLFFQRCTGGNWFCLKDHRMIGLNEDGYAFSFLQKAMRK